MARHARGLPSEVSEAAPALARVFETQVRALAGGVSVLPSPEARARLLGGALAGSSDPVSGGLRGLLQKRVEALHGEFRTVGGSFELVELDGLAGIAQRRARELWVGRSLIVNTPGAVLAAALESWEHPVPDFLAGSPVCCRRLGVQLRILREVLPEALAPRAILAEHPSSPACLTVHPSERGAHYAELTVTRDIPLDLDRDSVHDALETSLWGLFPFAEGKMARRGVCLLPHWDDELAQIEPGTSAGWPGEVEIRASAKPLVYALPRDAVFGLGGEGELLLGWRAGDTIAGQLRGLGS